MDSASTACQRRSGRKAAVSEAAEEAAAGDRVKSASRALDLMEVVAGHEAGLSFPAMLQLTGIPKSSLHALLGVLTARGYLDLDEASRLYTLGVKVWENGQSYLKGRDLVREARPVMDAIAGAINETVQLARLDGTENVYLAKVDSTHPLRLQSEVGARLSAHATGLGKALLACLADDEVRARFGNKALPRMTPGTIVTVEALIEELHRIRHWGFAVDDQEYTPGLFCVAVPIRDHRGQAIAAVSVSVPLLRLEMRTLAPALARLAAGSLEISRRLGDRLDEPTLARLADPAFAIEALVERGHGWSWVSKE
jgi:DNA-binding IclR family transcriptional regulator